LNNYVEYKLSLEAKSCSSDQYVDKKKIIGKFLCYVPLRKAMIRKQKSIKTNLKDTDLESAY